MTDFGLIRHNLFRKKLRAILMMVSIFVAFWLFGVLATINKAWNSGTDLAAANRLMTVNRINFTVPLPYAYVGQVRSIEGVENVAWANWFGGYYQEPRNFVQTLAVDPESYLDVYPEIVMPEDQRADFLSDRASIIIGEALATQYAWSVGDTIPLRSNIFTNVNGTDTWEFRIAAIFTGADQRTQTNYTLFHWENFNESNIWGGDNIGWMITTTTDPDLNDDVIAAIDERFRNSPAETETSTEAAFNKAFLAQIGNINLILTSVIGAAFATILMIVGTTMVMAIRERTSEIAVMKTIGFPATRIFRLVLGETMLLTLIGGLLGLGAAALVVVGLSGPASAFLPGITMSPDIVITAIVIMVGLGVVTGAAPAFNAQRVNIVRALGKD